MEPAVGVEIRRRVTVQPLRLTTLALRPQLSFSSSHGSEKIRRRIGISNHPSGPSLPTPPDARNRPDVERKLRGGVVCLANRAVSRHLPGAPERWQAAKPSCRAARKPLTLPFAGSGRRGSLPPPSPANRIAIHPALRSRLLQRWPPRPPAPARAGTAAPRRAPGPPIHLAST